MINVPVEVKDALREGNLQKNYRMVVLNDDGTEDFTIDNDTLVSESVSIDERMCSGDTIKFGLCEGSSLEFQYFDHPNITDRQVKVFCDVEYGANQPYSIPMGFFTVKNCSRQASTGIIKVTAYNKLQSDYLDAKANATLDAEFSNPEDTVTLFDIKSLLLGEYEITEDYDVQTISDMASSSYGRKVRGSALSFRATYGIQSPINYYEYRYGNSTTASAPSNSFYVYFDETDRRVYTDPTKVYKFQLDGIDLEKYEDDFFSKLVHEFTTAINISESNFISMLMTPYSDSGSGQGNYMEWLGYHQLLGLEIVFNDNENYYLCTRHYYSKYAYQYGLSNVKGSLTDASRKTFTNVRGIEIHSPRTLILSSSSSSRIGTYDKYIPLDSQTNYRFRYYTDSELTTYQESTIEKWMWLDNKNVNNNYYSQNTKLLVYDDLPQASLVSMQINQIPEFTLRDITSAIFEAQAQFGQLDRVTDLFSGVELNHSRLLPQDTLYPSDSLYPYGSGESAFRSQYSKLWADEGNIHKWRYLIITYKGLDGEGNEADFTLQRTINNDGTDDYNCSDNWLFRNLVWTAEQIGTYADAMVAKMRDITWFPFEMWCAGLPYLETGDEIEIPLGNQTYTSYILQRQLKGIQNLQDTYINGTLDIF